MESIVGAIHESPVGVGLVPTRNVSILLTFQRITTRVIPTSTDFCSQTIADWTLKCESQEAVKKKYFKGNYWDEIVIFLSRAIPVVPSVLFSAACGAIRINPASFYITTGLGLLVRGMVLGWVGWQSGEALFAISEGFDRWEMIVSLGLVAVTGAFLFWAYTKRNQWLANLRETTN